jgi:hypothetical protein
MKKSKKRCGLRLMVALIGLVQCSTEADGGAGGNSDGRAVLTAGDSPITVEAGEKTTAGATQAVVFRGAAELELTKDDFGVTGGGAVGSVSVAGDVVTITVTFTANEKNRPKAYNVVIASTSEIVRGDARVKVIHLGIGGEGPFDLYVSENGDDDENDGQPDRPFKTLAYAYTAALNDYPGVDTITVTSTLAADEAMVLSGAPANNAITSAPKPWTLTRSSGTNKSVVEVKNGAKVVFKDITIDGRPEKTGEVEPEPEPETVYHRALFIEGTATEVTLDNAHLVGKVKSGYTGANYNDGGGGVYVKSGTLTMNPGSSTIKGEAIPRT